MIALIQFLVMLVGVVVDVCLRDVGRTVAFIMWHDFQTLRHIEYMMQQSNLNLCLL